MRVNDYRPDLIGLTLDLLDRRPSDMRDVAARWRAAGMPDEAPASDGDLAVVLDYLVAFERLVDADDADSRVDVLNAMLNRYASAPMLTDHDRSGWHVHYRPPTASLGEALTASTTVAVADHLAERGVHRLGRCALADCRRAFADHSRPGKQRYCTHACANRDAVRRHRERARLRV